MRILIIAALCILAVSCGNQSTTDKTDTDTIVNEGPDTSTINTPPAPAGTDTVFTAFGNEPFWALYVIRDNKLLFHPADGPDVEAPYVAPTQTDAITRRYNSAGDSATIELIIIKKDCSDGMSDLTHRFETNVKVNAITYRGCGRE
jgi:uncharacterized membrane protein